MPTSSIFPTRSLRYRSDYDGRYYKDRVAAVQAMLEIECGDKVSRVAAEVWLEREADARISREGW